jgi:hypothetical protein
MQSRRILLASLVGTTIEFFDFYIYATAAALVFPRLFFPKGDSATALLQSLAIGAGIGVGRRMGQRPGKLVLAAHYGVAYVGYYLSATGLVTLIALLMLKQ